MRLPLRLATCFATPFAGALATAAFAVPILAGCGAEPGEPQPGTPSSEPGTTPPADQEPAATGTRALPIYYVADTATGLRLYREFHSVPPAANPATDAVREMFAAGTGMDPDYRSYWPSGSDLVRPVEHGGGVITVDLNARAGQAGLGAEAAERTVAQLVYTVQGALQSTDPVQFLIEGQRVDQLWGHVAIREPVGRGDPYAIRSLVQVDRPAHGQSVGRTFEVVGEAASFEANLPWEILRDGQVVRSGFATALQGQRFSAFRFDLTLEPGEYTLRVTEDDPSGGQGRPPFEDTKLIRVR